LWTVGQERTLKASVEDIQLSEEDIGWKLGGPWVRPRTSFFFGGGGNDTVAGSGKRPYMTLNGERNSFSTVKERQYGASKQRIGDWRHRRS